MTCDRHNAKEDLRDLSSHRGNGERLPTYIYKRSRREREKLQFDSAAGRQSVFIRYQYHLRFWASQWGTYRWTKVEKALVYLMDRVKAVDPASLFVYRRYDSDIRLLRSAVLAFYSDPRRGVPKVP